MKHLSKIAFFFLYVYCIISFISCQKDSINETIIPYYPVQTTIYFANYPNLKSVNSPVLVKNIGYAQHGIFVINIGNDSFKAFDTTCPRHLSDYTHILTYNNGDNFYLCKDCNTRFLILNGIASKDINISKSSDFEASKLQEYNCTLINNNSLNIRNYR